MVLKNIFDRLVALIGTEGQVQPDASYVINSGF